MKRIVTVFTLLLCIAGTSTAQNLKFGHINSQELISLMPERDSALIKLQNYTNEVEETITEMQQEYQTKYNTYQQRQATWTAAVLEAKQRELIEIQQRLEQFSQGAQQEYQQMQQVLFAPVFQKANEVIAKIAKDKGFTFIFDLSAGGLVYYNEQVSVNILPMAKSELGIPAEKVAPTQLPGMEQK
ncbi:MAG: OmpH family outer membrane protein [Bacteroidales bacterium]|jgi:outer membrane protein|nr:OmpH family outer membrane protein [Bacteroidales bacterium]MDD2264118.1 OmpH family outer membrane protein [Bacteroidales bacterium]MDD2831411.1 OmpH family outer membrane protein [Bacteroidales bacterium]MDD3208405.1 OmpH family outer membrane protein [Bacteroidales bacterium]MDD3696912.1 OmpH family outer membrane protein [Bacteroidales bacterium]